MGTRSLPPKLPSPGTGPTGLSTVVLALVLLLVTPARPSAHEIPADVTVRMLVKPEGDRLRVLVRAPLEAMRDMDFQVTEARGLLDPEGLEPLLRDAAEIWIAGYLEVYEDGVRLEDPDISAVRVSRPTDRSFAEWGSALAHVRDGVAPGSAAPGSGGSASLRLRPDQALLDVLLEYPIASARSDFAVESGLAHLGIRTTTVLRFVTPDGAERVYQFSGHPGLVRLDPDWHHAALRFVALGFEHILDGIDHLLFLLCLVIPVRRLRPLVAIVTSFTVAHSITLGASVLGLTPDTLWFPPLVETLIALSIVWMALENIMVAAAPALGEAAPASGERGEARVWSHHAGLPGGVHDGGRRAPIRPRSILERRWMLAFGFGLVHGFGFSFMLRESLQFAGSHLATSLLSFNLGVELGQLAVLVVLVPALILLFRHVVPERVGVIILSAVVAHTGWHWMTARGSDFLQHDLAWSIPDLFLLADLMRWAMLALVVGVVVWLLRRAYQRLLGIGVPGDGVADGADPFPGTVPRPEESTP